MLVVATPQGTVVTPFVGDDALTNDLDLATLDAMLDADVLEVVVFMMEACALSNARAVLAR